MCLIELPLPFWNCLKPIKISSSNRIVCKRKSLIASTLYACVACDQLFLYWRRLQRRSRNTHVERTKRNGIGKKPKRNTNSKWSLTSAITYIRTPYIIVNTQNARSVCYQCFGTQTIQTHRIEFLVVFFGLSVCVVLMRVYAQNRSLF